MLRIFSFHGASYRAFLTDFFTVFFAGFFATLRTVLRTVAFFLAGLQTEQGPGQAHFFLVTFFFIRLLLL
jgi:hypothetical protein